MSKAKRVLSQVNEQSTVLEILNRLNGLQEDMRQVIRDHHNDDAVLMGNPDYRGMAGEVREALGMLNKAEMKVYGVCESLRAEIGLPSSSGVGA